MACIPTSLSVHIIIGMFLLVSHNPDEVRSSTLPVSARKEVKLDGDIILGGLFPMHENGQRSGQLCGAIKEDKGIQRLEAMLYAIDQINKNDYILPGIRLGTHILDTCLRDTYALEQSLEFIKAHMNQLDVADFRCSNGLQPKYQPQKPVAGVIGAAASPVSIMVANILRLFKIPQISYASTGIELSDKSRFEYFSRVVPPDTYQAQALADIVTKLGWSYVSTLADEGNYGEKGIAAFEQRAKKAGVCIAISLRIPRELTEHTFTDILHDLDKHNKAKVVVMFVNEDNVRRLLRAAIDSNRYSDYYWLASDSWGSKTYPIESQEYAAEGAVTILPQKKVIRGFDEYFTKLNPINNTRNPWFSEFWEKHFKCSFTGHNGRRKCTGYERFPGKHNTYNQEGLVPFVLDAVYAMAHALHRLHAEKCPLSWGKVCKNMLPVAGPDLLQQIRNLTFTGATGNEVAFNEDGDAMGRYTIYQFQRISHDKYEYVPIGSWKERLDLQLTSLRWKSGNYSAPKSVCSEPCAPGYVRNSKGLHSCCWACIKCTEYEVLRDEYTCWECPNGSYPNYNKTLCLTLPLQYMDVASWWAIIPVIFSSLGILATLFILVVFIKFEKTPIIMASGRELCYVLLFGLGMCYTMTFVMVSKPTMVGCLILRLGLGLSLSICYSALFTKTNRISRIFNRGIKAMVKRPSYTSPKSQLVICFSLVSIQCMGAMTWIGMELPGTTYIYPDRRTVILRCRSSNFSIVMSLLYNMILIILCTVYAFKTRKIPENYNEAKYIAFTMYSTCIVWLAFVPIYFGTTNDFKIQITALCMCLSISATVAMGCLFAPKVYIVLFQPHKNVRTGVASALNPTAARGRTLFGRQCMSAMNGNVTSPTGLALLIAQGTPKPGIGGAGACADENKTANKTTDTEASEEETTKNPCSHSQVSQQSQHSHHDVDSLKDLESSGPETSEPETNL